jgi:radical SAM superfamily enzyme YgiQ (UPF0313 family)
LPFSAAIAFWLLEIPGRAACREKSTLTPQLSDSGIDDGFNRPLKMQKKCLLISPPGELDIFPRGIMEIATFLNQKGLPTAVLPLDYYLPDDSPADGYGYIKRNLDKKEIVYVLQDAIAEADPQVIGISNSYTKDHHICIEIIKLCKQIMPQAITVMGGQHATFCDEQSLQTPELDIVVRGEGEGPMLELLRTVKTNTDVYQTPGISFNRNGKTHRNPAAPLVDAAEIPAVDFGLLPQDYIQNTKIHGLLTRGCNYHCAYCVEQKFWGRPRSYRLKKLIEEMKVLQRDYHTQMVGLEESMLDMRSRMFFDLCHHLAENKIRLPEQFYLTTRIDTVSCEGMASLRRAGIKIVCVGIESFSTPVLKMMNKRQNCEAILHGCRQLREKNIWLNSYWIIGHPGDNPREAEYTFAKFKDFFEEGLLKSGYVFIFVPYPGTDFFNNPSAYGIQILSYDWQYWRRWTKNPVSCLTNFSDREIVWFYEKACRLLDTYKTLNVYLYDKKNVG